MGGGDEEKRARTHTIGHSHVALGWIVVKKTRAERSGLGFATVLSIAAALASVIAQGAEKSAEPVSAQSSPQSVAANAQRVAVLLTDWAEPEGFDPLYRREVVKRSFSNRGAESPDEPCTENYVGKDPYRVQLRAARPMRSAVRSRASKARTTRWVSIGCRRMVRPMSRSTTRKATVAASAVPTSPGMITPAKDVKKPLQRSLWAIDPRATVRTISTAW